MAAVRTEVLLCLLTFSLLPIFGNGRRTRNNPYAPFGTVSFFTLVDFRGYSYDDNYSPGCHGMPPYFQKNTRSVNPNGKCIEIYEGKHCNGVGLTMQPWYDWNQGDYRDFGNTTNAATGHPNQSFRDRIMSWKPCDDGKWFI